MVKINPVHIIFFSFLLICACQKEISFEGGLTGEGTLVKNAAGDCMPITLNGRYQAGVSLTDSNTAIVNIHLVKPGIIRIVSDTLNGYSFSFTGNVNDTGFVNIALRGRGKPLHGGVNVFTIRFGTSQCIASVWVYDPALPASYSLSAAGASCISDSVYGAYIKGAATDTSNKIAVQLNVTRPGSYSIHTDTVNGYSFSGQGILTTTGIDTVFLQASGTPLQTGINTFTVKADSSVCTLTVTVYIPQTVTSPDLFPLTYASYWNYNGYVFPVTTARSIIDSVVIISNLYKKMHEVITPGGTQDLLFRKQGDNYYEYANAEKYTTTVIFNPVVNADINFLRENMTAGMSWYSPLYTGHATFGQDVNLQYHFTCVEADVSAVVNNKAFVHVYKVSLVPQLAAAGIPPGNTHENYIFWYAQGIGLIYSTYYYSNISNWLVN
ncbi:MAG: hypothetical protein IPP93_12125 [Chitinophagaceae bacterium]|nr:hypothetical protein [Chitinophagaceae bacterium]